MNRRQVLGVVTATAAGATLRGEMAQASDAPTLPMPEGVSILDSTTTPNGTVLLSCSNGKILACHYGDYGWSAGWQNHIPVAGPLGWLFVPGDQNRRGHVYAQDGTRIVRVLENL